MNLVDRRANPTGKSLPNRQRFLARAKHQIQSAITQALKRRKLGESGTGEKIAIPTRIITEPTFRAALRSGKRSHVMSGNRAFVPGDRIKRPLSGSAARGGEASPEDGGEQDSFEFELSKEEFLSLFFDELALPGLVKRTLNEQKSTQLVRAGFSIAGTPTNLNRKRTLRNSLARRISLHRPTRREITILEMQVQAASTPTMPRAPSRPRSSSRRRSVRAAACPISIRSTCATTASSGS